MALLAIGPMPGRASESPDRECCENPLYTFDSPAGAGGEVSTYRPLTDIITYQPPEEPEVPDYPGTNAESVAIYVYTTYII